VFFRPALNVEIDTKIVSPLYLSAIEHPKGVASQSWVNQEDECHVQCYIVPTRACSVFRRVSQSQQSKGRKRDQCEEDWNKRKEDQANDIGAKRQSTISLKEAVEINKGRA